MKDRNIATVRLLRHCYRTHLCTLKATTQDCSSLLTGRIATEHAQSVLQESPKHCYRSCHKTKNGPKSGSQTQEYAHKHGDNDEETMSKPKIVIEDLGGVPADFDDEAHPEDATDAKRMFHSQTRAISDKLYVVITKNTRISATSGGFVATGRHQNPPPVATHTKKTVFQLRDSTNICENMFFGCH